MKTLKVTPQFKKDLKRYKNNKSVLLKLYAILKLLEVDQPVPAENRPHKLTGNYRGCMECHIESDSLLIWWDQEDDVIKLLRFGSHSELF